MAPRSWARQGSEQLTPWQVVFAETYRVAWNHALFPFSNSRKPM